MAEHIRLCRNCHTPLEFANDQGGVEDWHCPSCHWSYIVIMLPASFRKWFEGFPRLRQALPDSVLVTLGNPAGSSQDQPPNSHPPG